MFENPDFYEDVINRIPLGLLAKPNDVTNADIFLASGMANFITGETIRVDGLEGSIRLMNSSQETS
jgi:enoyl-[acyl-carrier-protein] reductase (NADH)